jgi:hypothetical protein
LLDKELSEAKTAHRRAQRVALSAERRSQGLAAVAIQGRRKDHEALTKVGPNNDIRDAAFEVVSVINCRLPVRTDTGRVSGPECAEGDRDRGRRESTDRMGAIHA